MRQQQLYYVAFIIERDMAFSDKVVTVNGKRKRIPIPAIEAGVDLLAGPFGKREDAERAIVPTCWLYRKAAVFAALADLMTDSASTTPVRFEAIAVTEDQVDAYNVRHGTDVAWPPQILETK